MDPYKILLFVGLALTIIGCVIWRSGGKTVVNSGAALMALAAFMLVGESVLMRSACFVVVVLLALPSLLRSRRADWRRPEMLLLVAIFLVVMATYFLYLVVSPEVHMALLVLLGLLGASFIAMIVQRVILDLRSNRQPGETR